MATKFAEICEIENCTGCSACINACGADALSMQNGSDGFLVPYLDKAKCIDCGLCYKVCPSVRQNMISREHPKSCYAVCADDNLRKESSSGGVFSLLAHEVLTQGGIVYGAAFDDKFVLTHVRVSNLESLEPLRKSKYLQSDVGLMFRSCKKDLESGKTVLFVGTPCQIGGLKSFLGEGFTSNLILVDLICHGVPSQHSFDKYVQEIQGTGKFCGIDFRDKKNGWGGAYLVKTDVDGCVTYATDDKDFFLSSFFANINLRNSCYSCTYADAERVGDITIGDFWGVPQEMNDKKGTSVMLLNTSNGERWGARILEKSQKYKAYPVNTAINAQPQMRIPSWRHQLRDKFLHDLEKMPYSLSCQENICSDKSVAILNYHWENVNFGAVLTAYALNRFLNDNGFFAQNIDYIPSFPWILGEPRNELFDSFRKRHLPVTKSVSSWDDLRFLNEFFKNFVVGADQVWRPEFMKKEKSVYFLDFADPKKRRVAYAASFGVSFLDFNENELEEYSARLKCFDSIGVRERSGVEICKKMRVDAECVTDPVFLLEKEVWERLADEYEGEVSDEIVHYTINDEQDAEVQQFIQAGFPGRSYRNITWRTGIQEWLQRIRKSSMLITDSFHGSCFALIFNVPFVCINTNSKTSTRMESLFRSMGSVRQVYSSFDDALLHLNKDGLHDNYEVINNSIKKERENGRRFLVAALSSPVMDSEMRLKYRIAVSELLEKKVKQQWDMKRWTYYRYKILKQLTWGGKKNKYTDKYLRLKSFKKECKKLLEKTVGGCV